MAANVDKCDERREQQMRKSTVIRLKKHLVFCNLMFYSHDDEFYYVFNVFKSAITQSLLMIHD